MSRIQATFEALQEAGKKALIPFVTAGDPSLAATEAVIPVLAEAGADLIELGIPFSDPMADGPTIQAASQRALGAGASLAKVLDLVRRVRRSCQTPIVLMGYYNPVFIYGNERFARDAAAAGVDGLLLVDLPPEEADEIHAPLRQAGIDLITLLAPTTPPERRARLAAAGEGYLYYVSMTGVTGSQAIDAAAIAAEVAELRRLGRVPVAVGFGITSAADAAAVSRFADGVVVGSALVKLLAEAEGDAERLARAGKFIRELRAGIDGSGPGS